MKGDLEDAPRCPRCGGPMGNASIERGICSWPCLSCDYVEQGSSEGVDESSRVDAYAARFVPAFHEEVLIAVFFAAARDSLVITLPADSENLTIPSERGLQFLEELAALDPLGVPDTPAGGIDGITVSCVANEAKGTRSFAAWSPDPRSHPRQHGFILALLRLARDLARKPETVKFLAQLGGYLGVSPRP